MAAITRFRAVPGVFLWLVLCVPGPPAATVTIDATRDASFSVVLSAPFYPAPQLVRVKADPPSRPEAATARPQSTWLSRPTEASTPETALAPDPPSVVLSCPPLAPRPPPAA